VVLPCLVPREWLEPPDADTAGGQLLDENDERAAMLGNYSQTSLDDIDDTDGDGEGSYDGGVGSHHNSWHRLLSKHERRSSGTVVKDSSGRALPVSERAPTTDR
jgi:hypothetical protein